MMTGEAGQRGWLGLAVGVGALVGGVVAALVWLGGSPGGERAGSGMAAGDAYPRVVETAYGPVAVQAKPGRIVAQTLMSIEALLAIGLQDRLVGVHPFAVDERYSNVVAEAEPLRDRLVQSAEEIIALEPDLVVMASYSRPETVAQVRAVSGSAVVAFGRFDSLADVRQNLRALYYAVGEDAAGEALLARMDAELAEIQKRLPAGEPIDVVEYGPTGYASGAGTLMDDLLRWVGGRNVAAEHGVSGISPVGVEQVASWDPAVIVCGADPGFEAEVRDRLLAMPALAATRAGRSGRVVVIETPVFSTVSQHMVKLVARLAAGLHPELPGSVPG